MSLLRDIANKALWRIANAAKAKKRNNYFWCYTIEGQDGSPYITRVLFPRLLGVRPMLHHIHRADEDEELHSHPWRFGISFVLLGGYLEERLMGDGQQIRLYHFGKANLLTNESWHKIVEVVDPTWTLFFAGPRVGDDDGTEWSFLNIKAVTPWKKFLARRANASVVR